MVSAHAMLGTKEYSVTRYAAGTNVGGRLQLAESEDLPIQGRIQPLRGGLEHYRAYSEVHRLRIDSAIIFLSDEPLRTESADGLTPADRLTANGRRYEVVKSDDNRQSVLSHCYAELLETLDPDPTLVPPEEP